MVLMNLVLFFKINIIVFNFFFLTAKIYHDLSNLTTDKNTLYSVDLNLNNEVIWKQEHIWFPSEDQSIGM